MKHVFVLLVGCLIVSAALADDPWLMPIEDAIRIAKDLVKGDSRFDKKSVISARLAKPTAKESTLQSVWRVDFASQYPASIGPVHYVEVPHEGKSSVYVLGR